LFQLPQALHLAIRSTPSCPDAQNCALEKVGCGTGRPVLGSSTGGMPPGE